MKKIVYLFLLMSLCASITAQNIEKIYHFDEYKLKEINDYHQIELTNSIQSALVGQPSLPWYAVSLLLPQGSEAESIEVICSDFIEIKTDKQLYPYQPSRAYSDTETKPFYKDESLYSSKSDYPNENQGVFDTYYMNGYAIANTTFTPIKYMPSENKIYMAQTVKVKVNIKTAKSYDERMTSSRPEVINRLRKLVDNPEMIDNYRLDKTKSVEGYELLIITSQEYVSAFEPYLTFYNDNDVRSNIVTTEQIYSSVEGVDNQDKIRNCIINEYQGCDIMMVLLGGDVDIVPYRGFYGDVLSGGSHNIDNNIPADLYFAALDGSWNDDNDDKWGEIGEDDLYPEIGVARFPFNNEIQLNNMLNKTISYQTNPVLGEFRNVILAGEHLYDYPNTNGSDYLELIVGNHDDNGYYTVGIPEDYNYTRLYAEEGNWSAAKLRDAINGGTSYVHHVGHANTDYVAGWYGSSINADYFAGSNGKDHNYTIFHSHGCDCANFPASSIMEKLVTISTFAIATIGNSRYGWFNEGQTEGPSCHLHREMTDAFWADRIPYLGLALTDSKCQTAPFVNAPGQWEEGALRWNFYDLNILGDVAVKPWHEEPFNADVRYDKALVEGATSTSVHVSENGVDLSNFRCSVYDGKNLIGYAITDENGNATIELSETVEASRELTLKVTGMNSFLRSYTINCISDNEPYVYVDRLIINDINGNNNGEIDFGEEIYLNAVVKNLGLVETVDLNIAISSCNTDYFTITDNWAEFSNIEAQSEIIIEDAFSLKIDTDAPNAHPITANLTCDDYYHYWYSSAVLTINAPEFLIEDVQFSDNQGNNNGILDAGETIIMSSIIKNIGGSDANNAIISLEYDDTYIDFESDENTIDIFTSGEEINQDFVFTISDEVPEGYYTQIVTKIVSGRYMSENVEYIEIGRVTEDFETADFTKLPWVLDGDSDWFVTDEDPYDGNYCARSGAIDNDEISSMKLTINHEGEPDTLSFYIKISSEERNDYLAFLINDNVEEWWSGDLDWTKVSYIIPEGNHQLEWRYDKAAANSAGEDCAWIDRITFPFNSGLYLDNQELAIDDDKKIIIYPNPNDGVFYLELDEEVYNVLIINSLGQIISNFESVSGTAIIGYDDLESGLYFVKIYNDNHHFVKKIIVK